MIFRRKTKQLPLLLVLLSSILSFQLQGQIIVNGHIVDDQNLPLIGATISTELGLYGTVSDELGQFTIEVPDEIKRLYINYLGFRTYEYELHTENNNQDLKIQLDPDVMSMDEVVVSASFTEKSKMESSVSITSLNPKEIELLSPVSAMEALKYVPGIYVNEANGEVGVEIQGRGLGTRYFSIQEDGLPSAASEFASNEKFTRDMFLRSDLMTGRLEAIRGGSASITTANSPGGVFNHISRQGKEQFELQFRNRLGLQANGKEQYNKFEWFAGGPINHTDWRYAIGGHYRYDGGNRQTLFPFSKGQQVKANISRIFSDKFAVKFYGKYLDDRVGFIRPSYANQWHDIQPAPGFDWDTNLLLPDVQFDIADGRNIGTDPGAFKKISTRDQQKIDEKTLGLSLSYLLNDHWQVKVDARYSKKNITVNHIAEEGGFSSIAVDSLFARLFPNFNWLNPQRSDNESYRNMILGVMEFYDINTGEILASVDNQPLLTGRRPVVNSNNLPGTGELFWGLMDNDELSFTEYVQQIKLNGTVKNHRLTFGTYYHSAANKRALNSGTTFLTIEPNARILGTRVRMMDFSSVSQFVPELQILDPLSNQVAQFSNESGLHGYNMQVFEINELKESAFAVFANDDIHLSEKLNLEFGFRYELLNHSGRTGIPSEPDFVENPGGLDGDILTVHNNSYNFFGGQWNDIDKNYNTFSYSAGINYRANQKLAFYARHSSSEKLLESIYANDLFVDGQPPDFVPRTIDQTEIGIKYAGKKLGLFGVLYRSHERNIRNQLFVICTACDGGFYLTNPVFFNAVEYIGMELETTYKPKSWWSIRGILNISGGTNKDFKTWNTGPSEGPEDDVILDLSGKPVAGSTARKFDLSPVDITNTFSFGKKKGTLLINYRRFAERFANSQQAFTLPDFGIWKLGVTYQIRDNISASYNINNLFNEIGVLRFNGIDEVAGFPENVTPSFISQNPDQWFKVQRSLPRAMYVTLNFTLK